MFYPLEPNQKDVLFFDSLAHVLTKALLKREYMEDHGLEPEDAVRAVQNLSTQAGSSDTDLLSEGGNPDDQEILHYREVYYYMASAAVMLSDMTPALVPEIPTIH